MRKILIFTRNIRSIMSETLKWTTQKRKIKELIPYEQNPRQMTEKQKKDLEKSIKKFDLVEIPAVDTDSKIISGHQRIKIFRCSEGATRL